MEKGFWTVGFPPLSGVQGRGAARRPRFRSALAAARGSLRERSLRERPWAGISER